MAAPDFRLNVWRLHPQSSRIIEAEKSLNGTAHPGGLKFCKPYSSVNALGWWLFPAVDVDIRWLGGKGFEHKLLSPWPHTDHQLISSLIRPGDGVELDKFCPDGQGRSKFTWGAVEDGVVQMWTGCIFETPPGYCLQIRSPINFPRPSFRIMEGILETDWMQYDIWANLVFEKEGEWVKIRKDEFPPLAQLLPIRRECVDGEWKTGRNEIVSRGDAESNRVFEYWLAYNHQKFGKGGKQYLSSDRTKDGTAYFKKRAEVMGKGFERMEPDADKVKARPLSKVKVRNKFVKPQ